MKDDAVVAWGSGTVISDDGLILTNAHVATPSFEIDGLTIAVSDRPGDAPETVYNAEVVASDPELDLALIRPSTTLNGDAYQPGELRPARIGRSSGVRLGDRLRILGYPEIGGATVTVTEGVVSGFNADPVGGPRAWIKTDATIAGGNSGGMAVNRQGELIGVPTLANAAPGVEPVDCRPIQDTNQDGALDSQDNCVPLGGFVNGIRPVDLASEMIDDALAGEVTDPDQSPASIPEGFDPERVVFGSLRFDGVTPEIPPPTSRITLPSDTTRVCAWWRFRGMADGVRYDAVWAHEGEIQKHFSFIDEVWAHGERGDYWVCFFDQQPIEAGFWELALNVEGELVAGGFVAVGDEFAPVDITITNGSENRLQICGLWLSPRVATVWGAERLGSTRALGPGQTMTLSVAPGEYDVAAVNCDGVEVVRGAYSIPGPTALTVYPMPPSGGG